MRLHFISIATAFLLGPTISLAQCSADASNTFRPFKGSEDNTSGHFEWDSAAGPNHDKGGGHPDYAVERNVRNLATATLKYSWPVGRMHNDALAGPKPDHYCYEVNWPNQNAGPLNYGRGNDHTDTKVWEGSDEPKQTNAIWATFSLNIKTDRDTRIISMRVLNSYSKASDGSFSYDYLFESVSGGTVTLKWGVERDPTLLENLKSQVSPVFVLEGKKGIRFTSKESPTFGFRSLNVVIGGEEVAGVEVPMFIPGKPMVAKKAN